MTVPIGQIAPISPIAAIPPILSIPRIAVDALRPKDKFRLDDWPEAVVKVFGKGRTAWLDALKEAIDAGIKDEKRLADLIFFMHHPERMKASEGKLIDPGEDEFVMLRAEWNLYRTIVVRRLRPSTIPTVFQKPRSGKAYEDYVTSETKGVISLFVNGREWDGKGGFKDDVTAYNEMQLAVEASGSKDSIFIANWQFRPDGINLTISRPGMTNWGDLLLSKAKEGVRIRAIVSQHPPGSPFQTNKDVLETLIKTLDDKQANFKCLVSQHPHILGTHHQKLLIVKTKKSITAFCGGLDISFSRTPPWSTKFVWHDIHAKLEGLIAQDVEREFVFRWNREQKTEETNKLVKWDGTDLIKQGPPGRDDSRKGKARNKQMLRTVSFGIEPKDIRRDDIWQGYFRLIGRATRFLYLENQYFNEPRLGDAIARQAESQPGLIVMVAVSTGTDDLDPGASQTQKDFVLNGRALRYEFFKRLSTIPKNRLRIYTIVYPKGLLHSKLAIADDEVLTIGSANANPRGFFFDTEINVMVEEPDTIKSFRHRLWAHNLGSEERLVAGWREADFFTKWDTIAEYTRSQELANTPENVVGEGVLRFEPLNSKDPRFDPGKRGPIQLPWPLPSFTPRDVLF